MWDFAKNGKVAMTVIPGPFYENAIHDTTVHKSWTLDSKLISTLVLTYNNFTPVSKQTVYLQRRLRVPRAGGGKISNEGKSMYIYVPPQG